MNENKSLGVKARVSSFVHAIRGLTVMLASQPNAQIHLLVTIAVIVAASLVELSPTEWCFIVIAIALVWIAECINTSLEFLCDVVSPDFHPLIKKSKDVAATSVLIASTAAIIIGAIILGPKMFCFSCH